MLTHLERLQDRSHHPTTVMDDPDMSENIALAHDIPRVISMVVDLARTAQMLAADLAERLVNEVEGARPRRRRRVSTGGGQAWQHGTQTQPTRGSQASGSGTQNAAPQETTGDHRERMLANVCEIWHRDGLAERFNEELQSERKNPLNILSESKNGSVNR